MATGQDKDHPLRIAEMHLADGRIFSEVTVRKVNGDSVSVLHSTGATTIRFELLSPADAKTMGFSKESVAKTREDKQAKELVEAQENLESAMINAAADLYFMRIDGNVLQVFPNAVLLTRPQVWSGSYESWIEPTQNVRQYLAHMKKIETCLVYCDTTRIVDGNRFLGIVGEAGTYTYQNTLGSNNTVRAFTCDLEAACKSHVPDNAAAIARTVAKVKAKYDQDRMAFTAPLTPND